jgi:hypothetical protein
LEVVESSFAEDFESAAYANFATPAETSLEVNTLQINESTAVALVFVMPQFPQRNSLRRANCANASGRYSQQLWTSLEMAGTDKPNVFQRVCATSCSVSLEDPNNSPLSCKRLILRMQSRKGFLARCNPTAISAYRGGMLRMPSRQIPLK